MFKRYGSTEYFGSSLASCVERERLLLLRSSLCRWQVRSARPLRYSLCVRVDRRKAARIEEGGRYSPGWTGEPF
jgi:hypothetical protein